MSTLLQLWREVCERSPALVNPDGKHLIVRASDCLLLGCEIERIAEKCTPDESLVWMLTAQAERTLAEKNSNMGYRDACMEVIREVLSEFMLHTLENQNA
jgi:hypothetical protein